MRKIGILLASVREGRKSDRIARYLKTFIEEEEMGLPEIIDLKDYNFPVFEERLRFMKSPEKKILEFAEKITACQGIIIVTPEYNGGYPASLKNVIDLLYQEWKRKPVAICMVSDGIFGGTQVVTSLLFTLWKIGAWMVPSMLPIPQVDKNYDENGIPKDKEASEKRTSQFLNELLYCMNAQEAMNI